MYDLSICIPARNEIFLAKTIDSILSAKRGNTEVIAILDGYWSDPPIQDHPDVTLLHYSESIGQRAATNRGVAISSSKYVAKCDAHCAFDEGFDVKLMNDMQDDWTVVPTMRNLWAFSWVCENCGDTRYQGPTPIDCPKCDNKTNFKKDVCWIAKESPQSNSYCFDIEPHFQYFRDFSKRPEGRGDLTETMSLQGSFFMMTRERYLELNVCDESLGSWGSQGIEIACKSWLSGGKVIVNHKSFYGHMFRTQGGFGFPYELSGKQTEWAKKCVREMFFENKWDKQVLPLSWLIEKFWPISVVKKDGTQMGWSDVSSKEVWEKVKKAGEEFISKRMLLPIDQRQENTEVTELVSKPSLSESSIASNVSSIISQPVIQSQYQETIRNANRIIDQIYIGNLNDARKTKDKYEEVFTIRSRPLGNHSYPIEDAEVEGNYELYLKAANDLYKEWKLGKKILVHCVQGRSRSAVLVAGMLVKDGWNSKEALAFIKQKRPIIQPSEAMMKILKRFEKELLQKNVSLEIKEELISIPNVIKAEPTKELIYYTDNRLDPVIMQACQEQLLKSGLPIISVSLQPINFGRNIILPFERSPETMVKQILAGLELSQADVSFLVEHDVLYHTSHFEFTPEEDIYYYNKNHWTLRYSDGFCVYHDCKRQSQLCANRQLLLNHYRKKLRIIQENGFSRRLGFEPGSNNRPERVDDIKSDFWVSTFPNINIGHDNNLTELRWHPSEFRNHKGCPNWKESDCNEIEGWENLRGILRINNA